MADKRLRLVFLGVIVVAAVIIIHYSGVDFRQFTPTRIKEFIKDFGMLAPLVFIAIYASRAVILVIPVGIVTLVGGLAFGKWWGTVYVLAGATIGSTLAFLIARYFGRGFVESFEWLHKGRIKQFDDKAAQEGFKLMLFLRLIPLFQYDAVNFGAGLSRIKLRDFVPASLIGMAPGGFIGATLGSTLENVKSVQFFLALGAFVLLILVPLIYKRIKKKRDGGGSAENLS
ncbi:MAG: TVP38/TMEM64 family protein [Candidatus Eisenbacteria bacterium]